VTQAQPTEPLLLGGMKLKTKNTTLSEQFYNPIEKW
jgi:hypothetical protein